jgi:hypothetical protein
MFVLAVFGYKLCGDLTYFALFCGVNGFGGVAEFVVVARLDFDEDKKAFACANHVYFAYFRPEIALDYLKTRFFEIVARYIFARLALKDIIYRAIHLRFLL